MRLKVLEMNHSTLEGLSIQYQYAASCFSLLFIVCLIDLTLSECEYEGPEESTRYQTQGKHDTGSHRST